MREVLLRDNSLIRIVNLHGSQKVGFLGAAGASDQNVFDILQGVSISFMVRETRKTLTREYSELIGNRDEKNKCLFEGELRFSLITPIEPYYLLIPWTMSGAEYKEWPILSDVIQFQSVSGKPGDDELLISFDKKD